MKKFLLLILLMSGLVQAKDYSISAKSKIAFEIIKFKIGAPVFGQFKKFSGKVNIEENSMKGVKVKILAASIDSGDEKRDRHLRDEDFFDVKRFESLNFESVGTVEMSSQFKLKGKLTMKGVTKDVVLDVVKKADNLFVAKTTINRLDYGVSWNRQLEKSDWKSFLGVLGKSVLDDKVKVSLVIHLD